jgi:ATP synthase protein I
MVGLVGWSVAIPTVLGVVLGLWLDLNWPSRFSWTLTLLLAGAVLGALNAWYWVSQEQQAMDRERQQQPHE